LNWQKNQQIFRSIRDFKYKAQTEKRIKAVTPHTQKLKWIINLNISKNYKSCRSKIYDHCLVKAFLDMTPKSQVKK